MLWEKTEVSFTWSLTKCQPDPKPHAWMGTSDHTSAWPWPKDLTKCHPDLKPDPGGYIWSKGNLIWRSDKNVNLSQSLILGGISDQRSAWSDDLTKGQPIPKSDLGSMSDQRSAWPKDLTKMSMWPKAWSWGVTLTKGQPDPKIWQKCQSDLKPQLWEGSIWLSVKRTSENLSTLCVLCFASQRSFLQKTNKKFHYSRPA